MEQIVYVTPKQFCILQEAVLEMDCITKTPNKVVGLLSLFALSNNCWNFNPDLAYEGVETVIKVI